MKVLTKALGAALFGTIIPTAMAHGGAGDEVVTNIFQTNLPAQLFAEATAVRVDFAPGGTSSPHRHPGHAFVVVLSGEIESAVDGQPPHRYKAGEAWYEEPNQLHRVTRNPSTSQSASLVAWLLSNGQEVLVQPANER